MLLLLPNEVEKRGELPEEEGNLLVRETMKKEELIKELHLLNHLLDELVERTHEKICNSQNNCTTSLVKSKISYVIKVAILKKAAFIEKNNLAETVKKNKKERPAQNINK